MASAAAALPTATAPLNRDNVQPCVRSSFLNGVPHLSGFSTAQAQVAIPVAHADNGLETAFLACVRLLLNQVNVYNFLLKVRK
jgi:hypothetical protein